MNPTVQAFFHEPTFTVSYLVIDPDSRQAAVVDPVLDFDPKSGRTSHRSADGILAAAAQSGIEIVWLLETHVHADHLSATAYLKEKTGAPTGIGAAVSEVQRYFKPVLNGADLAPEGRLFDRLFADGDRIAVARLEARIMHTPGHTPACISYLVGDAVFVGDTLFMPDYGTARCDFPGGSASALYRSIRRLLSLPRETRIFLCHDYKAPGRDNFVWETTVGTQRSHNLHIHDGIDEAAFVAMREARDRTLEMPALIIPSIQVNMRAGQMPAADNNGTIYLRLPLNRL
jgi:glyoxylase-like metal-dependent hydrolase (beta-lactamase superfamily II)